MRNLKRQHFTKDKRLFHLALTTFLGLICTIASAQFSTSNLQYVHGTQFHDPYYGYNTESGQMDSLMFEHYGMWNYGDNYFFVEGFLGDFLDFSHTPTGDTALAYSEGCTRISLSKVFRKNLAFGPFSDLYISGGYELGRNFNASLYGLSLNIPAKGFTNLAAGFYLRDDNLNSPHGQFSIWWLRPFKIGSVDCSFNGCFDFAGTDHDGIDINGQPQLLFDMSKIAKTKPGDFEAGIEWYYHSNKNFEASFPTLLLKWRLH